MKTKVDGKVFHLQQVLEELILHSYKTRNKVFEE